MRIPIAEVRDLRLDVGVFTGNKIYFNGDRHRLTAPEWLRRCETEQPELWKQAQASLDKSPKQLLPRPHRGQHLPEHHGGEARGDEDLQRREEHEALFIARIVRRIDRIDQGHGKQQAEDQ